MNLEEIRELILLMKQNNISEINLESEGSRLRLRSKEQAPPPAAPAAAPTPAPPAPQEPAEIDEEAEDGEFIRSPIVGVFYRSSSPDKPPFVDVDSTVGQNTVVCIIEAMKVMNEIKAEVNGRITRVLVEDGQPVEYGQPLFAIETT